MPDVVEVRAARDEVLARLWAAEVPTDEIGRELGISRSRVSQLAKRLGLPARGDRWRPSKFEALLAEGRRSADRRTREVARALRGTNDRQLSAVVDDILVRVGDAITPEKIATATLVQLMTAFGIAFDKRQIMRGQPTDILRIEERKALTVLVPALLKEVQRRGIVIEGEAVSLPEPVSGGASP